MTELPRLELNGVSNKINEYIIFRHQIKANKIQNKIKSLSKKNNKKHYRNKTSKKKRKHHKKGFFNIF